jgi:hypothetical protein
MKKIGVFIDIEDGYTILLSVFNATIHLWKLKMMFCYVYFTQKRSNEKEFIGYSISHPHFYSCSLPWRTQNLFLPHGSERSRETRMRHTAKF